MVDITSLYGEPTLNFDFLFEANAQENKDALARYNATMLAVLKSSTRRPIDIRETFNSEYGSMSNVSVDSQNQYFKARVGEISRVDIQDNINFILSSAKAGLPSAVGKQPTGEEPTTPSAPTAIQMVERLAASATAMQEGLAPYTTSNTIIRGDGALSAMTAINAYRNTTSATDKAKIKNDYFNYLQFQTLEALGHDLDLLTPEYIDDWVREFFPGKFTYEVTRYGGLLDQLAFNKLSPEQQMAYAAEVAANLIDANADPLTILSTLDRFTSDQPLFSGPVATSIFTVLDLTGLLGVIKYGPRTARLIEKTAILRKLRNSPAIAASTGDTRVAGQLTGAALMGDAAQEMAIGLDKVTAGMNASPFKFAPLDANATDGIAADTLRYIEDERAILNYKLNQALARDSTDSAGFLRPEERPVAEQTILSRLPSTAEVTERTPFGVGIKVVTKNNEAFTSPEQLAAAQNRYDIWSEAFQKAEDEIDIFYSDAATGKFEVDAQWANRLEATRNRAKQEMDDAYRILTKGIEPDKVQESFVFYNRSMLTGGFDGVMETGAILPKALSPQTIFSNIDSYIVSEKTNILAQQSRLNNLYKRLMSDVLATLSKKEAKNVDAVLLHGDDLGVRFSASELARGVDIPGRGTVKLNKRELASYFKSRDLFDSMHGVHNIMKYRRFKFENYKMTSLLLDNGSDALTNVKLYVQDAVTTSKNKDGSTRISIPNPKLILDARGNTAARMTEFKGAFKDDVLKAVQEGKAWVVKFEKPQRIGNEMLNYGIVPAKRLKELDLDIIPYRTGYVPRIYDAVPYVVRQERNIRFDGLDKRQVWTTERFFMNRSEAEAWAATKTQEDSVMRSVDTDRAWRAKDSTYVGEADDAVRSGLYESERGQKILFGTLGEEAARLSAFGAMDRYLGNLAYTMPLNEWRQGVIQRYFNSVNQYLEIPNDFGHLTDDRLYKSNVPKKVQNAIEETGRYLQEQVGLSGEGERLFNRLAYSIADNIENSFFWNTIGKVAPTLPEKAKLRLLYGADNVDAYGWLRNAAFRAYLGFFSVPQLFVQASNMATVFSLHPVNGLSVARRILALRAVADLSPSNPSYEKIVRIAAKSGLMKYEDFEPIVRAWAKSGLYYSTRISADTAMASRGISPGGDFSRMGKFVDSALLFPYQEGELWSRMYAFLDSATRLRKADPAKDITNIDNVQEIVRESFKVAFNYTQANKATWQKGAASIPTQFLQAPLKFFEGLLAPLNGKYKGQFTLAQRARLVLGQMILFGTAGVPVGSWVRDQMAAWLTTGDETGNPLYPELTSTELELLTGGVTDFMASTLLSSIADSETSIAVAERMALGGGLNLTISNIMAEDAELGRIILGAVGGVTFQRALPALEHVVRAHGTQVAAGTFTPSDVMRVADKLGTITSTWNAIHRARLWERSGAMVTREGTKIKDLDLEEDMGIIRAKALGFRSYDEIAAFRLRDYNEESNPQKEVRDALRTAQSILNEYTTAGHMSEEGKTHFSQELYVIRESLKDEGSKREFDEQWGRFLMDDESMTAKEYRKFIERQMIFDPETMGAPPADLGTVTESALEEIQGY